MQWDVGFALLQFSGISHRYYEFGELRNQLGLALVKGNR
jgi:hypothetical protein